MSILNVKEQPVRVLVVGHKEFSQLMTSVLPEFSDQAIFKILDTIVDNVADINQYINSFNPDVIVSAGANAAYLKSALDLPVLSLACTVNDIIQAVTKASQVADKIVMINFAKASPVIPLLASALAISIQEEIYTTPVQARELFQLTRKKENIAYVGASLVCGLANQHAIPAFMLYSTESCRETITQAINAAMDHIERNPRCALTDWLLQESKTPIFMTDEKGTSITFNHSARASLGVDTEHYIDLENLIHPEQTTRPTDGECCIQGVDWWYHQDRVLVNDAPFYIYQLYQKKPKSKQVSHSSRHQLVYQSSAIEKVMTQVKSFSFSPSNVLIYGESGTGKELIARAVHQHSPYANGNFVALNCSAVPTELFEGELFGHREGAYTGSKRGGRKGLIEEAQHGVLFLDEISELALDQQSKLLRFLQERHYRPLGSNQEKPANIKLVAASNKDLKTLVAEGRFREDLFFRLNVFNIYIPPLHQRPEDILTIAKQKLTSFVESYQLAFSARQILPLIQKALINYTWPGNVRELENVLERIVASIKSVNSLNNIEEILSDISPELFQKAKFDSRQELEQELEQGLVRAKELELVAEAMTRFNGDKQRVATYLGLSPTTLWRRLKKINYN